MLLNWCHHQNPPGETEARRGNDEPSEEPHQPGLGQHCREGRRWRRQRQAQRPHGGQQGGRGDRPAHAARPASAAGRAATGAAHAAAAGDGFRLLPRPRPAGADGGEEPPADAPLEQAGLEGLQESGDALPVSSWMRENISEAEAAHLQKLVMSHEIQVTLYGTCARPW